MTATEDEQAVPVFSLSKEDLLYARPDLAETIATMTIDEFARIANKLNDALSEHYWMALDTILDLAYGNADQNNDDEPDDDDNLTAE